MSLAYAQAHPKRVTELVLRGIFMLRDWEIHWFYQHGASAIFPDHWANHVAAIPPAERGDLVGAFSKRLTSRSRAVQLKAAKAWAEWEAAPSATTSSTRGSSTTKTSCCGACAGSATSRQ